MSSHDLAAWFVQDLRPRRGLEPSGSPQESHLLDVLEEIISKGDAEPRVLLGSAVNLGKLLAVRDLTESSFGAALRRVHVQASAMIDEGDLDAGEVRELIALMRKVFVESP